MVKDETFQHLAILSQFNWEQWFGQYYQKMLINFTEHFFTSRYYMYRKITLHEVFVNNIRCLCQNFGELDKKIKLPLNFLLFRSYNGITTEKNKLPNISEM